MLPMDTCMSVTASTAVHVSWQAECLFIWSLSGRPFHCQGSVFQHMFQVLKSDSSLVVVSAFGVVLKKKGHEDLPLGFLHDRAFCSFQHSALLLHKCSLNCCEPQTDSHSAGKLGLEVFVSSPLAFVRRGVLEFLHFGRHHFQLLVQGGREYSFNKSLFCLNQSGLIFLACKEEL